MSVSGDRRGGALVAFYRRLRDDPIYRWSWLFVLLLLVLTLNLILGAVMFFG